jgi:hypothetical protein
MGCGTLGARDFLAALVGRAGVIQVGALVVGALVGHLVEAFDPLLVPSEGQTSHNAPTPVNANKKAFSFTSQVPAMLGLPKA